MKKTALKVLTLLIIGLSHVAFAHEGNHGVDGKKCEGMANGSFSISYLDTNKDGNISKAEYLAGDKSNTEKTFAHLDANSDGNLDQDEQKEIEEVYKKIHEKYKENNISI